MFKVVWYGKQDETMLRDGVLTRNHAILPENIQTLTIEHAMEGQTFVVPEKWFMVDQQGLGWIKRTADIDPPIVPEDEKMIRVIKMEQGLIIDLFTREPEFERPDGFKISARAPEFDEDNYLPVVDYVTMQREYDSLGSLYQAQFKRSLSYEYKPKKKLGSESAKDEARAEFTEPVDETPGVQPERLSSSENLLLGSAITALAAVQLAGGFIRRLAGRR